MEQTPYVAGAVIQPCVPSSQPPVITQQQNPQSGMQQSLVCYHRFFFLMHSSSLYEPEIKLHKAKVKEFWFDLRNTNMQYIVLLEHHRFSHCWEGTVGYVCMRWGFGRCNRIVLHLPNFWFSYAIGTQSVHLLIATIIRPFHSASIRLATTLTVYPIFL